MAKDTELVDVMLQGKNMGINLDIMTTTSCNLSCNYCCQSHEKSEEWTLENLLYILNLFDRPGNTIDFLGGEPLLKKRLILEVLNNYTFKHLSFRIISNGLMMSEDVIDAFYMGTNKESNFIGVSLDSLNVPNRRNLSNKELLTIINNIKLLVTKHPYRHCIYSCISRKELILIPQYISYLYLIGVRNFAINTDNITDWSIQDFDYILSILQEFYISHPDVSFHFLEYINSINTRPNVLYPNNHATILSNGKVFSNLFTYEDERTHIATVNYDGTATIHIPETNYPCASSCSNIYCGNRTGAIADDLTNMFSPSSTWIKNKDGIHERMCKVSGYYIEEIMKLDGREAREKIFEDYNKYLETSQ